MGQLSEAIAAVNARELDANEQALAKCFAAPPDVPAEARQFLIPFISWCESQRVRSLPAHPASVAAFAQWQKDNFVPREKIAASLSAIEAMHFAAMVGNPVATPLVRTTTSASTIEPPRSWTGSEKQVFAQLPVEIQAVVARREQDRERTLRRAQNDSAELKRRLIMAGAENQVTANTTNTEGNEMAKVKDSDWNGPQNSESMGDTPLRRENKNSWAVKDISGTVNRNADQDDGFSGKLTSE